MKKFLTSLILFTILWSCSEKTYSPACNTEDPLKMEWMKEIVSQLQNCACTISIFQAEYEEGTIFWPLMNDPLCQGIIADVPVYNCRGEEILTLNDYEDWVSFNDKVTERKIIYACSKN